MARAAQEGIQPTNQNGRKQLGRFTSTAPTQNTGSLRRFYNTPRTYTPQETWIDKQSGQRQNYVDPWA